MTEKTCVEIGSNTFLACSRAELFAFLSEKNQKGNFFAASVEATFKDNPLSIFSDINFFHLRKRCFHGGGCLGNKVSLGRK